jgi:hypothetical protein
MRAFIQTPAIRRLVFILAVPGLIWALAGPADAQGPAAARQSQTTTSQTQATADQNAEFVREQFIAVLRQYSPALGRVLALDPGLMSREDYMATYPAVSLFLKEHPEILRNPSYYLARYAEGYSYSYSDPRTRAWNDMMEMISVGVVMLTIVFALGWMVRTAVDYRRWGRLARVQAEAHTKLLDRFTGNEELLAYVKSPAGAKFLESAPITLDGNPRQMNAPLSRILWSMNAGVVLTAAGIGMNYISGRIDEHMNEPVFTFGVILISVGIGFLVSAALSFVLSKRLGLIDGPRMDAAGS